MHGARGGPAHPALATARLCGGGPFRHRGGARLPGRSHRRGRAALAFVDNPDWAHNNILASLLCAADHLPGGFFFSYCDIVYTPEVVARLAARARAADPAPVSLIIDRRWADAYQGRTLHPVSEAELTRVDGQGRVVRVGKGAVAREKAVGEFIGLAHFSAAGAAALACGLGRRPLRQAGWRRPLAWPRRCARRI